MRLLAIFSLPFLWVLCASSSAAEVNFSRQVRPILADKCYACHGPDKKQRQGGDEGSGGLHFDTKDGAFGDLGGYFAIVPGRPDASELIERINSTDPDVVMPPPDHNKPLSQSEKEILAQWIRQGANWQDHWAYVAPRRSTPPQVKDQHSAVNFIDRFVRARLEQAGVQPAPEADRRTLLRRLSFDIVGLPPSQRNVQAFVSDATPAGYETIVDQLLASDHFGERLAMHWLDLVRYADTVGYHGDQNVSISPYRDYVIAAFNNNMPYDRFTREQLGGDLLPNATRDQLIASGYNRLGMMSAEGGVQPKEYLAKYASDRVRTASAVWLGSTLGCAECHEHKYDPFTTKDFYRFASFFADIKEKGLYAGAHASGKWGPSINLPNEELAELLRPVEQRLADLQPSVDTPSQALAAAQRQWEAQRAESTAEVPADIGKVLAVPPAERNAEQAKTLAAYYRSIAPSLAATRKKIEELEKEKESIVKANTRSTLITVAVEPRQMRVLPRGNWMDDSGEPVEPGVPHFLRQLDKQGRANRLDLADWLCAPDNPLTARVFVNRLWKLYFGVGLSKVLDDVGGQGEAPTHPELLDTLAVEFVESGWDIKHLVKLIVMSRTYRQASLRRDSLDDSDPYNRLLARQARFRLDAELVRDNALAVSGLLVPHVGGSSVKPYQPVGLYRHLNFPKRTYQHDAGDNQYRRGLYTHWQRQFLHPALKALDAPPREECAAQRARSNTPLAALVLLNDPSYVEAARVFAARALRQEQLDVGSRISWMMQRAFSRDPDDRELQILTGLQQLHLDHYRQQPEDAQELISTGQTAAAQDIDAAELAAWTSVARTMFNMHEFITRN